MDFIKNKSRILILAPHTDDAEFGMGGTINKFIDAGMEVYCAAFSACKQNVLPDFPEDILIQEVKKASAVLGIKKENLFLFEYQVRTFHKYRQEILDEIIQLREKIKPDMIFIPSVGDIHQDHKVISEEGIRAFKHHAILCYELPWNNFSFTTTCFSILTEAQVQKKADAIAQYQSQKHRNYADPEFAWSLARTRGVQINQRFAECFEIIRLTF
jgi:LmbE family N-acetylglucosaminyl deacetylase